MRKIKATAAVLLACALSLSACARNELAAFYDIGRFGSVVRWAYIPEQTQDAQAIWSQLSASAQEIEADITTESADSSIARLNAAAAGERVKIGKIAYDVLIVAQEMYAQTGGKYNPATGLLVDLWGFSPRHRASDYTPEQPYDRADYTSELPDEKYIRAFSSEGMLDFGAVELGEDENGYYAVKPENACVEVDGVTYTMQLNLSGIGKGYCADRASEILSAAGQQYGYYNLGGSSMLLLADPSASDGVWEVTANAPRPLPEGSHYATLRARDMVITTSGDYEQYYEIGGVRYCHIIDPDTGYPIGTDGSRSQLSHVVCASIVGGSAAEGDARATAMCCMSLEEALAYAAAHADTFRTLFVWYDAQTNEYTAYSNLEDWRLDTSLMRAEAIA